MLDYLAMSYKDVNERPQTCSIIVFCLLLACNFDARIQSCYDTQSASHIHFDTNESYGLRGSALNGSLHY